MIGTLLLYCSRVSKKCPGRIKIIPNYLTFSSHLFPLTKNIILKRHSLIIGMVVPLPSVPISCRIIALVQERNSLFSYPLDHLTDTIRATGFQCKCCGQCCTRAYNGHVFLLDRDSATARTIDPASLEPAPDPEFCDQNGIFYVSGYAVRTLGDAAGSCWFLENGRCRIYDRRFSVCRVYPYMLRRGVDEYGRVDWRHIMRLFLHGALQQEIPIEDCLRIARETREYENAALAHEIAFLELMREYFAEHGLHHDPERYDQAVRLIPTGKPVTVMVYHDQDLEEHIVQGGSGAD